MSNHKERRIRRARNTRWKKVDRYIKNRMLGQLRVAATAKCPTSDTAFGRHVKNCSFVLCMFLSVLCHYNRWYLRRYSKKRPEDVFVEDVNNGACGLMAYVGAVSWNRIRKKDELPAEIAVFPSYGNKDCLLCSHAMVLYDDKLWDGDCRRFLSPTVVEREAHGKYRICTVLEDKTVVGNCIVFNEGQLPLSWIRGNWIPFSRRRAERLVDVVLDYYREQGTER